MAHLVLDCDGVDVIAYELIGDIITIGRSLSNDVVIDNPTVSAQPASLAKLPSGYHLKDLGSTNGTQVNGISISDAELMDGAEIRFAYVTGVFQNAIASIAHATELQLPGEHDCPAPLRIPETQAIFGERAQTRDDHPHDPRQQ